MTQLSLDTPYRSTSYICRSSRQDNPKSRIDKTLQYSKFQSFGVSVQKLQALVPNYLIASGETHASELVAALTELAIKQMADYQDQVTHRDQRQFRSLA